MAEKYYVNTVGNVPANNLSEAISIGATLAEESKAAGAERASIGTIMTGGNSGSVVFQQFFNSLDDCYRIEMNDFLSIWRGLGVSAEAGH